MMKAYLFKYVVVSVVCIAQSQSNLISDPPTLHQLGPCTCEIGDKIVDLVPLGFRNNTPRFKDQSSIYPFAFSWNPCFDFNEGSCRGVAGCQRVAYPRQHYSLGTQKSAKFLLSEDGNLQIKYTSKPSSGFRRILYVTLMCSSADEGENLIVNGERSSERAVYDLTLYSKYACPSSSKKEGMKLSIGSIILITVGLLVFVYVAAGVLFQVFVRKAKGLQVLPHVSYWSKLPGVIKDGCLFVKRKGHVDQMYQPVT